MLSFLDCLRTPANLRPTLSKSRREIPLTILPRLRELKRNLENRTFANAPRRNVRSVTIELFRLNAQELKDLIISRAFPTYGMKYKVEPSKNVYNISSLTHGVQAFLRDRERRMKGENQVSGYNRHLWRGIAYDTRMKEILHDWEADENSYIKWTLPRTWKNGLKDISLIGHRDHVRQDIACVADTKAPESEERFKSNGSFVRAQRQVATYAKICEFLYGKPFQAFLIIANDELNVYELTREEIENGWQTVKRTAYAVALELDK